MKLNTKLSWSLIASLLLFSLVIHRPAQAHAALETSNPGKDAMLQESPNEIALHFNENLEGDFSTIKVTSAHGNAVAIQKAEVATTNTKMLVAKTGLLKPGKYHVEWVAVGYDGHRRKGDYFFTLK